MTTDDVAYCWGDNYYGELGDGTTINPVTKSVMVVGGLHFKQVSAGFDATCGVTTDNRLFCWGDNTMGLLANGARTGPEHCGMSPCSTRPIAVGGSLRFLQVGVSHAQACALTSSDRRAYCWGVNNLGQLGDGTTTNRFTPVPVVGGLHFSQISVNGDNTCGVTTDSLAYCWGDNSAGEIGDSTSVAMRLRPTRVSGTHKFRQISAGIGHTCAVTPTARAYCWGSGTQGELGNGKTFVSSWPRRVSGDLKFRRMSSGWSYTCAETMNSRAYCWGYFGNDVRFLTPTAVQGGLSFAQLSAGWLAVYGKTTGGVLYVWGDGSLIPAPPVGP